MEETVIKVPWCFKTSECIQEQWDIIRPYRAQISGSDGDKDIDDYGYNYIGVDSYGNSELSNNPEVEFANNIYTPSELVRLIQGKDKTELEVGKWYKFAGNGVEGQIGKYVRTGTTNIVVFEPWLNEGTSYVDDGTFCKKNVTNLIELTDLSEIQQYLPEGHVDKIVKTIEKWSEGTYVVVVDRYHSVNIGDIHTIGKDSYYSCIDLDKSVGKACQPYKDCLKWFATLPEAEEFAKTLKEPVKSERYRTTMLYFNQLREPERSQAIANYDEDYSEQIVGELYTALNSGFSWASSPEGDYYWQDISDIIENGTYFKEEPKDYKEAVHCTTQEEWDFVLSKFNPHCLGKGSYRSDISCFILNHPNFSEIGKRQSYEFTKRSNYTILTFKQWCDKYNHSYDVKPWVAQVGDWVYVLDKSTARNLNNGDVVQCVYAQHSYQTFIKDADGYRLHNKLYRKATQEEIDSVTKPVIIGTSTTKGVILPTLSYAQRNALPEQIATGYMIRFAEDNKTYVFGNDTWNVVEPTTEWTADNWYVKVSSQEEANEIIRIAAKIYGYDAHVSYTYIDNSWEYVTLRYSNPAYCIQCMEYIKDKKERPISDFIGTISITDSIISTVGSNNPPKIYVHPEEKAESVARFFHSLWYDRLLTPSESHLPNLITKSKSNILDTKVNVIKSISINLQQKPKTIKL